MPESSSFEMIPDTQSTPSATNGSNSTTLDSDSSKKKFYVRSFQNGKTQPRLSRCAAGATKSRTFNTARQSRNQDAKPFRHRGTEEAEEFKERTAQSIRKNKSKGKNPTQKRGIAGGSKGKTTGSSFDLRDDTDLRLWPALRVPGLLPLRLCFDFAVGLVENQSQKLTKKP